MLLNDIFIRDEGVFGRRLSTSSKVSLLDQVSTYLEKEWKTYKIIRNKMLYTDEESTGEYLDTHIEYSLVE